MSKWQLELLVVGDNITPERAFVTLSFVGQWPQPDMVRRGSTVRVRQRASTFCLLSGGFRCLY
jgi:hypothetical protein